MIEHPEIVGEHSEKLGNLCAAHLHAELQILERARQVMARMKAAFASDGLAVLAGIQRDRQEVEMQLADLRRRRADLRLTLRQASSAFTTDVRISDVIRFCPASVRIPLLTSLAQARRLADELLGDHHWLSVHLRIHLETYGRVLRECIGAPTQAGRYGPDGKVSADEYRSILEVLG